MTDLKDYMNRPYSSFSSVEEFMEWKRMVDEVQAKDQQANIIEKEEPREDEEMKAKEEEGRRTSREEKVVRSEALPVAYADLDKTPSNIFKHIIIFTNNRDPKENKTLKNILDAVKDLEKAKAPVIPVVHVFVAAKMNAEEDESSIWISDGKEEMTIKDESNIDTLVFSRLGVQDEDNCEHIVKVLQDRGFLALYPFLVNLHIAVRLKSG